MDLNIGRIRNPLTEMFYLQVVMATYAYIKIEICNIILIICSNHMHYQLHDILTMNYHHKVYYDVNASYG